MENKKILLIICCLVVVIILIISIINIGEWEVPWDKITAAGTIITGNVNYINFTLNLTESNFSGEENGHI